MSREGGAECSIHSLAGFFAPGESEFTDSSHARDFPASSWPGLSRPSTSLLNKESKTWIPGTKPGHDGPNENGHGFESATHPPLPASPTEIPAADAGTR